MVDIGFNNVPSNQRVPGIYPEIEGDIPGQPPQWTLMIGQTVASQPQVPVKVSSVANAVRRFGAGSMLASMVERYLASDPNGTLWVLPLEDYKAPFSVGMTHGSTAITGLPAGLANGMSISGPDISAGNSLTNYDHDLHTADLAVGTFGGTTGSVSVTIGIGTFATGVIDFTHSPNEDGVIYLYIAGRLVMLPVTANQAATDIAANMASAVNGYFDANDLGLKRRQRNFRGVAMPVTAAVISGHETKVGLTANNAGTCGNDIDIQLNYYGTSGQQETPVGLSVDITPMSGGAADPLTSDLDSVLGDTQYDFIIQPYTTTTALNDFQTLMSDSTGRWSPLRKVYGHVFSAASFPANGSDAVTFGTARNDRHMTVVAYEQSCPTPPYDVASSYAGTFAASSRIDPARPTQTLGVVDILAPHRHQRFSNATRQTLLGAGLALMEYEPDYTCRILRAVTTYQLDANGTPDISYRDAETLYTLMAVVRRMTADWGAAYPRAKIVDDDVAFGPGNSFNAGLPDQPIVTVKSGKAVLVASYSRMTSGNGQPIWVTDTALFSRSLILQRNSLDPTRLDALLPIVLASGLRITAMKLDFALQAPA